MGRLPANLPIHYLTADKLAILVSIKNSQSINNIPEA